MVDETVHAVPVQPASPDSSAPSQSATPSRPQLYGAIGAIATYAIVIALKRSMNLDLPEEVQAAIPVVIGFLIAYVVPPTARQVALRMNDRIVQLAAAMKESPVSKTTVVLPQTTKVVAAKSP